MKKELIVLLFPVVVFFALCKSPNEKFEPKTTPFNIIAYYHGNAENITAYPIEKLTHIIFSFCHLNGNRLTVDEASDSLTIRKLVELKTRNSLLKVMLSLGGWGGCATCSDVFASTTGRQEFALSVRELQDQFGTDGIDLDWEYPAIAGFPEHTYKPEDKEHFTLLVKELRNVLGEKSEISFAAGASVRFFENSCDWDSVMPLVDRVNLMTYDFYTGGSATTGHHTQLFSNNNQKNSVDYAVHYLDSIGVPQNKMVIGCAFYGRAWEDVENINDGLYQPGKYLKSVPFKSIEGFLKENPNLENKWDSVSNAPFAYDPNKKIFMSYDNPESVKLKTQYVKKEGLDGIMFWQLGNDKTKGGLLDAIYEASSMK